MQVEILSDICRLGAGLFGSQSLDDALQKVGKTLADMTGASYISFFSVEQDGYLSILSASDFDKEGIMDVYVLSWVEDLAKQVVERKRYIYLPLGETNKVEKDVIQYGLAVPLETNRAMIGVVALVYRKPIDIDNVYLLVKSICVPLLGELVNLRLYKQMEDTFLSTIRALSSAIDAKHPYTRGHSERVTNYSMAIGKEIGLAQEQMKYLKISALLHDIGKIGISDVVLDKHGKLTDEEFEQIRQHPVIGAKIVSQIVNSDKFISGILDHHERFDGKGYPNGKKGKEISLYGRIIAVADAFDAMTSTRSYRKALPFQLAVEEIVYNSGYQFDPKMVKAFVQAYEKEKEIWQRESIIYSAR